MMMTKEIVGLVLITIGFLISAYHDLRRRLIVKAPIAWFLFWLGFWCTIIGIKLPLPWDSMIFLSVPIYLVGAFLLGCARIKYRL